MATRWELFAVYGACRECHDYVDTHPKEKKRVFIWLMGRHLYEKLDRKSKTTVKYLPSELKEIRKELRFDLKETLANQSQVCYN